MGLVVRGSGWRSSAGGSGRSAGSGRSGGSDHGSAYAPENSVVGEDDANSCPELPLSFIEGQYGFGEGSPVEVAGSSAGGSAGRRRRAITLDDAIPWTFPSKCFEGMLEGAVFALVMMAVLSWWIPLTHLMGLPRWLVKLSGTLNFLTTGVSMLNFDYHLSPAVQKTVDYSVRYTFLHAVFRISETGARITQIGMWLNIYWIGPKKDVNSMVYCVGNYVLMLDYFFCVFFLFFTSCKEDRRYAILTTTSGKVRRIMVSFLTGLPMLIANLSEFVNVLHGGVSGQFDHFQDLRKDLRSINCRHGCQYAPCKAL